MKENNMEFKINENTFTTHRFHVFDRLAKLDFLKITDEQIKGFIESSILRPIVLNLEGKYRKTNFYSGYIEVIIPATGPIHMIDFHAPASQNGLSISLTVRLTPQTFGLEDNQKHRVILDIVEETEQKIKMLIQNINQINESMWTFNANLSAEIEEVIARKKNYAHSVATALDNLGIPEYPKTPSFGPNICIPSCISITSALPPTITLPPPLSDGIVFGNPFLPMIDIVG